MWIYENIYIVPSPEYITLFPKAPDFHVENHGVPRKLNITPGYRNGVRLIEYNQVYKSFYHFLEHQTFISKLECVMC